MAKYCRSLGWEHWTNVVGIRADEPRRVARMREATGEAWENSLPLASAGAGVVDVMAFWDAQPFDLGLRPWEGNCDLCFLKGSKLKDRLVRARPNGADWWASQEERIGGLFRSDQPSYATMKANVTRLPMLPGLDLDYSEDALPCACTD